MFQSVLNKNPIPQELSASILNLTQNIFKIFMQGLATGFHKDLTKIFSHTRSQGPVQDRLKIFGHDLQEKLGKLS